jgi:RNA polymerase sigma-70 factor, ECF subfamily
MGADGREHAWVRGAQAGRASDFEALFRAHWPLAHRAAYLVVHDAAAAEDIAQEAFLAAIRTLDRFDRRRPFAPWLHRIVVNRSLDWLRARARRPEVSVEAAGAGAGEQAAVGEAPEALSDELMRALAALEPDERALIVMRYLLGYRSSELGRIVGMPAGTVRTRLARALARLRELLEAEARSDT